MTPLDFDRLLGSDVSDDVRRISQAWQEGESSARSPLQILALALDDVERVPDVSSLRILRLAERILSNGATAHRELPRGAFKTQPRRRGTWYLAAGAVLCVLAVVFSQRWDMAHFGTKSGNNPVSAYVTGNGERANITLPDGNTVALNVASRLEVPADYLEGNHTLHLSGEALFDVNHHAGSPFTVIAGGYTARVLGTSFLVRHYAGDTSASVVVREGKVAVRAGVGKAMILTAGRRLTVNRGGAMQFGNADPRQFSFAQGVLTLLSEPLADAIPELDRWYDADIRFGDSTLAVHRLAGTLPAGSLSDLMDLLQSAYDIRIVRVGRVLTLYRK